MTVIKPKPKVTQRREDTPITSSEYIPPDIIKVMAQQVEESAGAIPQQVKVERSWRETLSTGSLLLDLAISGGKTKYGGLPGGTILEIYGENSSGKTTILGELWGAAQRAKGETKFLEPESKIDVPYLRTFGVDVELKDIIRPATVTEVEYFMIGPLETSGSGKMSSTKRNIEKAWRPNPERVNYAGLDSIASLASEMEMLRGDKMGQKKPKDMSEMFRRISDHIARYNILFACSNQVRVSNDDGVLEPTGGLATSFYTTVRIGLFKGKDLTRDVKLEGQDEKHKDILVYGQEVYFYILKNHLDSPRRKGKLRMIFNYGVDDLGTNLEWLSIHGGLPVLDGKQYAAPFPHALKWCEENNLEHEVREHVVERWRKLEAMRPQRKDKVRF
jgi:recombination protein RecA